MYKTEYPLSLQDPETFWAKQAKKYIHWYEEWEKVLSGDLSQGDAHWYQGGKLNAAYNCLDRHLDQHANDIAIIWESEDPKLSTTLTYQKLYEEVCRFANVLKNLGVKRGDRVCIYLPMMPEVAIAMLACTRIGAIHSVVFAGFSAESLKNRILDAECSIVVTANEGQRATQFIPLKQNVDTALKECPQVQHVIVVKRTEKQTPWQSGRDQWYQDLMAQAQPHCAAEIMDAEDPLFILYTSGSTGKPKGILHGTGGYLVYVAMTFRIIFDYHPGQIYWCTADVGWITGHSYGIYGPLLNAAPTLLFEGAPTYPTPARCWEIIDKYKVNIFYTSPTAIRALRGAGDTWLEKNSRASLKILGSVGEPLNPEAWDWYYLSVGSGHCPIVDTWWQTETGGIMLSPLPYVTPLKAGSVGWPFYGVEAKIVDDAGKEVEANEMGKLIITKPWPGMMQTIYGDHTRFVKTYFSEFPGHYFTGDLAYRDDDGDFWITGRSDDVIKVSGHRIGTGEVESALICDTKVAEAAVVAIPDAIKGQSIYAFISLKDGMQGDDDLKKELQQTVRQQIGAIAIPKYIQFAKALPKTRSGKIMRRLLRKIANNDIKELGDLSTLTDPAVIDALVANRETIK